MKRILLVGAAALALLSALLLLAPANRPDSFNEAKTHIVMRQVGHRLLQAAGDSQSPVLSAEQTEAGTYTLDFKRPFPFRPDTLRALVDRALRTSLPGSDYIVHVEEQGTGKVVFGYVQLQSGQQTLVPCLGRDQPSQLYRISIQTKPLSRPAGYRITGLLLLLAALPLALAAWRKHPQATAPADAPKPAPPSVPAPEGIALGRYRFLPDQQCLLLNDTRIALTGKEASLLRIFATRLNEVVDRQELQQVWDDEGVIVGRSLDVFISRLRRKLDQDPQLALVNIPRKGYRLELQ